MVALGEEHGVRTRALVTRMDAPLGRAVGNALEVAEAVEALRGEGPADLMEVTFALAAQMLDLAGIDADPRAGDRRAGGALEVFKAMIGGSGRRPGRAAAAGRRTGGTRSRPPPTAGSPGWTRGPSASRRGGSAPAGRARRTPSGHTAGVRCLAKPGDYVRAGSRCSNCTPTIPAGSPPRSRRSRAR